MGESPMPPGRTDGVAPGAARPMRMGGGVDAGDGLGYQVAPGAARPMRMGGLSRLAARRLRGG